MDDRKVHLDFETRSVAPFGKQKDALSTHLYARHPTTDIWLLRYAVGEGPVSGWDPWHGQPLPDDLVHAVASDWIICAHNATFEWTLWNEVLAPRYGAPPLRFEQMDDTAVRAAIMALPRSLEGACEAMKLPVQKDTEGSRLMQRMAKPRKVHSVDPDSFEGMSFLIEASDDPMRYTVSHDSRTVYEWWATPDRFERLGTYCDADVEAERALDRVLVAVPEINRRDLLLTHRTNQRGVVVDVQLAAAARRVMDHAGERYCADLEEITDGKVTAPTQVVPMRDWLSERGIYTPSLDKAHVGALLDDSEEVAADELARRMLEIRQAAGKSSVAKLDRFTQLTNERQRMLENFLYHGAATGRLAGKGAQLQNLPSRTGLNWTRAQDATGIILAYQDDPETALALLELLYGDVPEVISSCLRGHIIAPPGKALYVADFSNIEGRVAAWLAGETWKLQAFRDFDTIITGPDGKETRKGPDLYKVTAGQILGITPWDVDDKQRNVLGKVPELALGFEGGVGAFQSMAKIYRVNMAEHWPAIQRALSGPFVDKAHEHWGLFGSRSGIEQIEWLASETVKIAWRDKHPAIGRCWKDCFRAAVAALRNPGKWQRLADGKLAFGAKEIGGVTFLICRLPSGRMIFKAHAKLKPVVKYGREAFEIHYWGVDSVTKQWRPMSTYSGDLFQSAVQATAFDMMMHGWNAVEDEGFEVVLSVHDELGAEADMGRDVGEFEQLMSAMPDWAEGCPVVAAGYVAQRYRKG